MFVIQDRYHDYKKWRTLPGRYATAPEAQAALDKITPKWPANYRIAEEYTVTRYKAVKGVPPR